MKTCETITYTSPSDSYDEVCGKNATEIWDRKPCCKGHFKLFQKQLKDRHAKERRELAERHRRELQE